MTPSLMGYDCGEHKSRKSRPRNPTEDLGNIYDVKDNKESIRYYQK